MGDGACLHAKVLGKTCKRRRHGCGRNSEPRDWGRVVRGRQRQGWEAGSAAGQCRRAILFAAHGVESPNQLDSGKAAMSRMPSQVRIICPWRPLHPGGMLYATQMDSVPGQMNSHEDA